MKKFGNRRGTDPEIRGHSPDQARRRRVTNAPNARRESTPVEVSGTTVPVTLMLSTANHQLFSAFTRLKRNRIVPAPGLFTLRACRALIVSPSVSRVLL